MRQSGAVQLLWPFFDTEEQTISAGVNLVAQAQSDGSCRLDHQEVMDSTWDYHVSPLSIRMQANVRRQSNDEITVNFRGTVGAKGGGAVGAGVGDFTASLDIPNTP